MDNISPRLSPAASAMPDPALPVAIPGFEQRRSELLAMDVPAGITGTGALFALARGRDAARANQELRRVARWFDEPHPHGRDAQGEPDFAAIKLCRAWHLFGHGGKLEDATLAGIRRFFLEHDFASIYQSENHGLLFHSARYVMAGAYPLDIFAAYGKSGATLRQEERAWLSQFLRYRAGHGGGEFDSAAYLSPVWECLTVIFDFAPDEELRRLAGLMMDLLLADFEVDALRGMYGGAHGRIYPPHALDHAAESSFLLHYLYFGGEMPAPIRMHEFIIDALTSSYRPHAVLETLALHRDRPYENRERKHLHDVADILPEEPFEGSLRKYTFWTPEYVMGCVQYQDPYPEGRVHRPHHSGRPVPAEQRVTAGYAHHQQHQWDLSFATRSDARIFTHHPGCDGEHNHWTGDRLCGCGHFFQNRTALIAVYDIPAEQPLQWIHAYVPRAAFDEMIEEDGFVFVRAGSAYGALRILSGYRWTDAGEWKDREITAEGPRHGVICEAARAVDCASFRAFRAEIAANPVFFHRDRLELEYQSLRAGVLRIDARGGRWLDGHSAELDYAAHDSPFLKTRWRGTSSELLVGGETVTLDFSAGSGPGETPLAGPDPRNP